MASNVVEVVAGGGCLGPPVPLAVHLIEVVLEVVDAALVVVAGEEVADHQPVGQGLVLEELPLVDRPGRALSRRRWMGGVEGSWRCRAWWCGSAGLVGGGCCR